MLNPTTIFSEAFANQLARLYESAYGHQESRYSNTLHEYAKMVFERLSLSDALYHNAEHTAFVTLVGQDILQGRLMKAAVSPEDWLHFTLATLSHDIGYVRGVCKGDTAGSYVMNDKGEMFTPPRGASDACLGPYHIDRSKIAVRERFEGHRLIDAERIARAIELTRFPVPEGESYKETGTEAGLVRAADLIGQLADPFYARKFNALFHEFEEIGCNTDFGYLSPADIADEYPRFFWTKVKPLVQDAIEYLSLTTAGRQWTANLYCNVFESEHKIRRMGPEGNPIR